jgi:acetyl esterase/lipase
VLASLALSVSCVIPAGTVTTSTPEIVFGTTRVASATSTPVASQAPGDAAANTPDAGQRYQGADAREATDEQLAVVLEHAGSFQGDVTYCTVDGEALKMDVYLPKGGAGDAPLAVFIHGGGWSQGDKRAVASTSDIPSLLDAGFTVASLGYRLAPERKFPAMIEDVKCAIRSLRASATTYGVDPGRIGVWGMSAGAHLSLMIALADESAGFDVGEHLEQSSRVDAVVDMSGPTDLTVDFSSAFRALREPVFEGFDLAKASPISYVTGDDPPVLILQGEFDYVVPPGSGQAQTLRDKLAAEGVPVQLVLVKGGSHTLDAPDQQPSREQITNRIVQFFAKNVR